ncbi:MAG TPA: peptidylprolyl isomerase, partial [Porticoccaceae bacterium]|nr:peptidylprolyl isomerase [Porticoccaceae bacterium]
MTTQAETINSSSRVTMHFSLALGDGTLVDSNFEGQPASFTMGDGSLLR